jgi:hypothetical protein
MTAAQQTAAVLRRYDRALAATRKAYWQGRPADIVVALFGADTLRAGIELTSIDTDHASGDETGEWKPGDPCASCGSRDTHGPIPGCRTCGRSDADE